MSSISDTTIQHLRGVIDLPELAGTKYRLLRKIAEGGMGVVYLAEDTTLTRNVALKVINTPIQSEELIERILREARIVARLEHPGIVPIHDVGALPDGRVFYTMKYVQGQRLDEYMRSSRSLADRLRVFQKICEAVGFAHANNVIHRDLKPENIMVGSFGEVLVMDWGIAKVLHPIENPLPTPNSEPVTQNSTQTLLGTVLGTLAYMAPEQARAEGNNLDERTDIYSLGAILYFLLCNRPPFESGEVATIRQRVIQELPVAPRQLDPKIQKPIEAICFKAMAKNPDNRYLAVQDLATDIAKFLDGLPVSAYKEHFFERIDRWVQANRFIVFLIIAYLLMRIITFLFTNR